MKRALALAALLLAPPAAAQNYREMPIGGRTATMGGAGTAAGNDSAMPYLNPAGLAGVPGDIFALSATAYSYTHRSYRNFFYPNGTDPTLGYRLRDENFATSSVFELPSSVMYMNHLSRKQAAVKHFVGMSLIIPSVRRIDLVASASGTLTNVAGEASEAASVNVNNAVYYLGPSYAVSFGDRVRLGASLYAAYYRNVITNARSSAFTLTSGSTSFNQTVQIAQLNEALALAPILGVQVQVAPKVWLGAGVAVPSLHLSGRLRANNDSTGVGEDSTTGVPVSDARSSSINAAYSRVDPLRVNVGVAYEDRKRFSLAADAIFFAGREAGSVDGVFENEDRRSGETTRRYNTRNRSSSQSEPVVDFSLGGEVKLTTLVALRAGVFSDLAASPAISSKLEDNYRLRLDRYGGTLGLGLTLGSFDTTLGAVLARGEGQMGALDPVVAQKVVGIHATETTGMLLLSGATTVEDAKRTIRATLPFKLPELPDLGGSGGGGRPMPRIPSPLPPEAPPPSPALRSVAPPPAIEVEVPLPLAPKPQPPRGQR